MHEACGNARFMEEAFDEAGIVGEFIGENFESCGTLQVELSRAVDHTHSAVSDGFFDAESRDDRSVRQCGGGVAERGVAFLAVQQAVRRIRFCFYIFPAAGTEFRHDVASGSFVENAQFSGATAMRFL